MIDGRSPSADSLPGSDDKWLAERAVGASAAASRPAFGCGLEMASERADPAHWLAKGLLPNCAAGAAAAVRRRDERERVSLLMASGVTDAEALRPADYHDEVTDVFILPQEALREGGGSGGQPTEGVDGVPLLFSYK